MNDQYVDIAVQTRGSERVGSFYELLAGRPLEREPGFGRAWPGFEQIAGRDREISLIWVDCAETATMKAWDLGAEVLRDVSKIPNAGWYSVIRDPAGAKVGLFQPIAAEGGEGVNP